MYQGRYNGGKEYHPPDLDRVLARAWGQRVEKIVVTAGSLAEAREALQFVERDERLFTTVGVHPTRCSEFEENGGAAHLGRLRDLAASAAGTGKLVAVGECGLDYDRLNFCPKETLRRCRNIGRPAPVARASSNWATNHVFCVSLGQKFSRS